jgi:hypothetical protein
MRRDEPDTTWSIGGKKDPAAWALAVDNERGIAFTVAGPTATFWGLVTGNKVGSYRGRVFDTTWEVHGVFFGI